MIFPVAGRGTRTLPASKAVPKELLPVVDRPLIQHVYEEAVASGIEHFIFVSGPGKQAIEDHFTHLPDLETALAEAGKQDALAAVTDFLPPADRLDVAMQDRPLGLGHAVWCARAASAGEPVAVMLPDDLIQGPTPCLKQLLDVYAEVGGNVVAVMEVPAEETSLYGVIDPVRPGAASASDAVVPIAGLVEKPLPADAPSNLAVVGRYLLQPDIFAELDRKETGAGGEIQLTDAMARLIGRQPFHAVKFEGRRFDCGNPLGLLEANIAFGLADPRFRDPLSARLRGELGA